MGKIQDLIELQAKISNIYIGDMDRIDAMTPLMLALSQYGVTQLDIKIAHPSWNDGDPCFPYVSNTVEIKLPLLEERDDLDDLNLDDVYFEDIGYILKQVLNLTDLKPTISIEEVESLMMDAYKFFCILVETGKIETLRVYQYEIKDGNVSESDDYYDDDY